MTGCSALGCSNRSEQGFKMRVFPRDPVCREQWVAAVRRPNWVPTNHSYLCEVHFDKDQYEENTAGGRQKLKKGAIPTLFFKQFLSSKPPLKLPVNNWRTSNWNKILKASKLAKIKNVNSQTTTPGEANSQTIVNEETNSQITVPRENNSQITVPRENNSQTTVIGETNSQTTIPGEANSQTTVIKGTNSQPIVTGEANSQTKNIIIILTGEANSVAKVSGVASSATTVAGKTNSEVIKLKEELLEAKRLIKSLQNENLLLKHKMQKRSFENYRYKLKLKNYSEIKNVRKIFNEDQIEALKRKTMAFSKWSPKTIETAMQLMLSCGVKGYKNLLHLQLPFPSLRTLQRRLQKQKEKPGPVIVNLCGTTSQ